MERGTDQVLRGFLDERRREATGIDPRLAALVDELEGTVGSGGKRLRRSEERRVGKEC